MNLKMRQATVFDFEQVVNIVHMNQSYRNSHETNSMNPSTCALFFMSYFDGRGFINVFEDEEVIVAAVFHKVFGEYFVDSHVYVHKYYQGSGLGVEIMRLDAEMCKGFTLFSTMPEGNAPMLKAAVGAGWTVLGVIPKSWKTDDGLIGRVIGYKVCD